MSLRFEPKVTLGNILTVAGGIASVILCWNSLDKSVAVIQSQTSMIITRVDRLENMLFHANSYTLNEGSINDQETQID